MNLNRKRLSMNEAKNLELVLTEEQFHILVATKANDRGYVIVRRYSGVLIAQDLQPMQPGEQLFFPQELPLIFAQVLMDEWGFLPYHHCPNRSSIDKDHQMAQDLVQAERDLRIDKCYGYGLMIPYLMFYHIKKKSWGTVQVDLPFRLLEEHKT